MKKLYNMIWRWHFFCGIIFIPFIILLSITGAIYLFNDEYENFAYAKQFYVDASSSRETMLASEQLAIALKAYPDYRASMYLTPENRNRSTEIVLKNKSALGINTENSASSASGWSARNSISADKISVFVNPYSGEILGHLDDDKRLMNIIEDLHGELMTGEFGTKLVELTASWTLVLVITGLFLWWPRKGGVYGVLMPRLRVNKHLFWRDMHAVPAFYFSFFILFLLITGLPWTDVWGGAFKTVKQTTGQSAPASFFDFKIRSTYQEGMPQINLDKVIEMSRQKGLDGKLEIRMPMGKMGAYNLMRDSGDPVDRVVLQIDQYSGELMHEVRWQDNPVVEKAVSLGIKLHRGEYFGLPNQLLGLATALVLVVMTVTGLVMWLRRRPVGRLGAPPKPERFSNPGWLVTVTLILAVFLPLLGATLLVFWLIDTLLNTVRPSKASA